MGRSVIVVSVVGNHGCDRSAKVGEKIKRDCGSPGCVDCLAAKFAKDLAASGNNVESAKQTHWPDDENGGIDDDLLDDARTRNNF